MNRFCRFGAICAFAQVCLVRVCNDGSVLRDDASCRGCKGRGCVFFWKVLLFLALGGCCLVVFFVRDLLYHYHGRLFSEDALLGGYFRHLRPYFWRQREQLSLGDGDG